MSNTHTYPKAKATPQSGTFVVTPDVAQAWLDTMGRNRAVRSTRVRSYGADMKAGLWSVSPASIGFDSQGRMVDGQHRCLASVESGCAFLSRVTLGNDDATVVDLGTPRGTMDILDIAGIPDAKQVAAIIRCDLRFESKGHMPHGISARAIAEMVDSHPGIQEFAHEATLIGMSKARPLVGIAPPSEVSWLHYRASQMNRKLADDFYRALAYGEPHPLCTAGLHLRERLRVMALNARATRASVRTRLAMLARAWNLTRTGRIFEDATSYYKAFGQAGVKSWPEL